MIENFSLYSYLMSFIGYIILLLIVLFGIKKNLLNVLFLSVVIFSSLWTGFTTYSIFDDNLSNADILPLETLRNITWFLFLNALIINHQFNSNYSLFYKSNLIKVTLLALLFLLILETFADFRYQFQLWLGWDIRLTIHVVFSIIGLILVEQLYRNALPEQRWVIKFLCLGLGALFLVDFIIYSKSLLFLTLDDALWSSRGIINAFVIPLLAISFNRLQNNDTVISVSRKVAFHTSILFGTGLYLILMSLAGFYIRDYGGNWGEFAQIIFIFLALLLLMVLFASGKTRALIKVAFNKHFFHDNYDYREEWIKLSKSISQLESINELSSFIIKTMAGLVESSGGGLWLKNEDGDFYLSDDINLGFDQPQLIKADHSLMAFLNETEWIIDFVEFNHDPGIYEDVDLTDWYAEEKKVWLIVPLFRQNVMEALIVLTQARAPRKLNWEDHDLLKTAAMQLANALALSHASDELSRARQFEAYNRLSAFVVHDLKNLAAQVSLIVKNAEKHKHNPEFIDDSIATLENVANKVQSLVGQLKKGNVTANDKTIINLTDIIADVAVQQSGNKPQPETIVISDDCPIYGEYEKMTAILGHLVQNSQEATDDSGSVHIELTKNQQFASVKVIDTGHGMDRKFIAERLFKPFDTTKGNAGMGIGVYEARDYILKHSGQIKVVSEPGKGTVFTIKVPLANNVNGIPI